MGSLSDTRGLCLECVRAMSNAAPPMPDSQRRFALLASGIDPDRYGAILDSDDYRRQMYALGDKVNWEPNQAARLRRSLLSRIMGRELPTPDMEREALAEWSAEVAKVAVCYAELWEAWPRCESCPSITGGIYRREDADSSQGGTAGHCATCAAALAAEVGNRYPVLPSPWPLECLYALPWDEYRALLADPAYLRTMSPYWLAWDEQTRAIKNLRETWPRCENCPKAKGPKEAAKPRETLADRVLATLSAIGEMSSAALAGAVPGLSKNNIARTMEPLVTDGRVLLRQVATTRLYRVADD